MSGSGSTRDEEHLNILSIFYFVFGGITCVFSLFPILHFVAGIIFIQMSKNPEKGKDVPPAIIGWFFVIIAGFIIITGLTLGILKIYTGLFIKRRRHYLFCLIIASISCILVPYGTVLGVFSIIILTRDSVKRMFLS